VRPTTAGPTVLALALSACSGGAPSGGGSVTAVERGGVQVATITGTDRLRFEPSTVRAKPGQVELILDVTGGIPHNLEVSSVSSARVDNVAGGESGSMRFTIGPGRYQLICTYHPAMRGTLVVAP
jgi:plastocyanin